MTKCERLRDGATWKTRPGDAIEGERVYWSAREQIRSRPVGKVGADGRGRRFTGKVARGDCIDVTNTQADSVPGLMAASIAFWCNEAPKKGVLYHRSNSDQGMCGIIRENVRCEILQAYSHAIGSIQTEGH